MKSNLELLEGWISKNSGGSSNPLQEIWDIGHVLGQIMKEVNEASDIFKTVSKSPSRSTASAARTILTDVSNYQRIRTDLQALKGIINDESFSKISNSKSVLRMIHYLERAEFGPEQVARLKQIAEMDSEHSGTDFPEEVNQAGLEKLLRNSIYNSHDGSSKTLKVVREVLQNAVDATDPKQHPELESRPGFKPEIHIDTHTFHPRDAEAFIDISVEDKGIGMDWDTLSKKFFVACR
jgi:signal transduction histidine kinase